MNEKISTVAATATTTAPTLASIRNGDAYLKVNDSGSAVTICRTLLNNKGYTCDTKSSVYDTTLKGVVKTKLCI